MTGTIWKLAGWRESAMLQVIAQALFWMCDHPEWYPAIGEQRRTLRLVACWLTETVRSDSNGQLSTDWLAQQMSKDFDDDEQEVCERNRRAARARKSPKGRESSREERTAAPLPVSSNDGEEWTFAVIEKPKAGKSTGRYLLVHRRLPECSGGSSYEDAYAHACRMAEDFDTGEAEWDAWVVIPLHPKSWD